MFLAVAPLLTGEARASENHPRITGSWDVTVLLTRPPDFPPVKALWTFIEDGGFVMTANNVDPRSVGPGHGTWRRTGERDFGLTFIRFRFDPMTDPPTYLGTLKGNSTIQLNEAGDKWTIPWWTIDFYDPEGHRIGRIFEGTATARRIVEPLD
jgi:hypothetical protein